jgi:hypothetical protein
MEGDGSDTPDTQQTQKSAAVNETPYTKPLKGQTVNRLTGNQVWTEPRNVADCAARGAITLIR